MKQLFLITLLLPSLLSGFVYGQDTYLPVKGETEYLYDRLEALRGEVEYNADYMAVGRRSAAALFFKVRKDAVQFGKGSFSKVEQYNIDRAIGLNGEWVLGANGMDMATRSKRPVLRYFYTTRENFLHYNNEDFFFAANPIVYANGGMDMQIGQTDYNTYTNFRGAEVRGRIANRVGFYTLLGDNQEQPFFNVGQWESDFKSFPGNDYYRRLDNGTFDAFVGRGYFTVDVIPTHLKLTFGYDKQFIGNGIRSLVQSNEGAASTFLRLQTNVAGFQIDNLYQELVADFPGLGNDDRLPRKYASFHQVSRNIGKKVNIALFESTIYGADNDFKVSNLIPVIYANSLMRSMGADQKTSLGLQFKYLPAKKVQVYGQAMIDELNLKTANSDPERTKYAFQLGAQYFNAFSLANLDLQLEYNYVSPFMYMANNIVENNTHYNQPLAHPMGANFSEVIAKVRYQPYRKLYIDGIISLFNGYKFNAPPMYGNNIRLTYNELSTEPYMPKSSAMYANGNIAYELFTNFFIEVGGTYMQDLDRENALIGYGGIRWNIVRKQYMLYNSFF